MTCKEFIEHLLDYTEGDLSAETRRLCAEHSDLCKHCADYLDSYRATTELGREAFSCSAADDTDSYELPEDLVQSILAAARAAS